MGIGHWELLVILFVILLLFGAKRLPDLARGLGQAIREFKKASSGQTELSTGDKNTEKKELKGTEEEKKTTPV